MNTHFHRKKHKKAKYVGMLVLGASVYGIIVFFNSLEDRVNVEKVTKEYKLDVKF